MFPATQLRLEPRSVAAVYPRIASVAFLSAFVFGVSPMLIEAKLRAEDSRAADWRVQSGFDDFLTTHCIDCHTGSDSQSGLSIEALPSVGPDDDSFGEVRGTYESILRKLNGRQMPPADYGSRPEEEEYLQAIEVLESALDQFSNRRPYAGRVEALRRMNRTEYQNAIRDLLAVDINAASLLPVDEASHGFDNITVGDLSPTLLNRYVTAAEKISSLAVGGKGRGPSGETIRIQPDLTQEQHVPGLPLGTRGGAVFDFNFPRSGTYRIDLRLARDRNEHVEGLRGKHEMQVLLDGSVIQEFVVRPPKDNDHSQVDVGLTFEKQFAAGPQQIGVTFVQRELSLQETMRQPLQAHFNVHRHPRQTPALFQVSITGPFEDAGPGMTPSRSAVFAEYPSVAAEEEECAQRNLTRLLRRAYRREVEPADLAGPLDFYRAAREQGADFEAGMQAALSAILVNPNFLFRIERQPQEVAIGEAYRISDEELASRLSYFLWSSIPDEELLEVATSGRLSDAGELERQTRRMLSDPRSQSLVDNFAEQWLYLRNLDSVTPNARLYPDFDDNLRQAFRTETKLLFENILRQDLSVLELFSADYTYLNERLAKHYEIPNVYGSRFRKVDLARGSRRGGLLRHGSILTVTSYATRTSPVIRGHWILENLMGTPLPPAPPNVPTLEDNTVAADLPLRQRLAEHRTNAACAVCHDVMDPVGFALENYDAVGRWRDLESGHKIDASGGLPDGSEFVGIEGLEKALLQRPELFVSTFVEKLMTFAVGRGMEHQDAAAVRGIVREARHSDYQISSLVIGIVTSTPFQMRSAE